MVGCRRVVFGLVGVSLLVTGCGSIEDLEDDLSTITIPDVTIPDVTIPDVTLPDGLPDVTLPDIDLPEMTLPDIDLPDVTLPEVTLPELTTTTTVLDQVTTTAPAPSTTTSVVAITTTQPPVTTTTTTVPTTIATEPPPTTAPPTTVAETTTSTGGSSTTSTLVEAAPSTTLPEEDEGGSGLWWALGIVAVIGAGVGAWALDRARKEAAELAARQAEWDDRMRGAYVRGRWVLDQFDERLPAERSLEADPRELRAGVAMVVEDLYRLEADAVNVETRAAIRELSDAVRGLDRATDLAAGLLVGGDDQSSVEAARARLDAAVERLATMIQPEASPTV
jgi:hypothetical protein